MSAAADNDSASTAAEQTVPPPEADEKRSLGARLTEFLDAEQKRDGVSEERAKFAAAGEVPPPEAYAEEPQANGRTRRDAATASVTAAPRKLQGIIFADMKPHLADGYLIKGVFARSGIAAIIGPPSSGKTFLAADLAVHIAGNRPWRAHNVRGGALVYAALEGPVSAENRFCGARENRNLPLSIPLRLTAGPVNLRDPVDVALLLEFIRETETIFGKKVVAIFVDTLSRAMAGGDENHPDDMGALIVGADKLRLATDALVILVHHLGKDESRGARGHSSLKGALDTEIEVIARGPVRIATVTKQRDLPDGARFAFRLGVVTLGLDDEREPVTTCIVEHIETPSAARKAATGKNQRALVAALQEWDRSHPDSEVVSSLEIRAMATAQEIPRNRLAETVEWLEKFGYLQPAVGGHRYIRETDLDAETTSP